MTQFQLVEPQQLIGPLTRSLIANQRVLQPLVVAAVKSVNILTLYLNWPSLLSSNSQTRRRKREYKEGFVVNKDSFGELN